MKLVIQGDKIAAMVGDDFPTADMLVDVPDGFDLNQAHRFRYNVADGQIVVRVPETVTRRQAIHELIVTGWIDLIQPTIDAITDPVQRRLMQSELDDSQEFERHRPSLVTLATAIGMSENDLDNLFIGAAQR